MTYNKFISFVLQKLKEMSKEKFYTEEHYELVDDLFRSKFESLRRTQYEEQLKRWVADCHEEEIDNAEYEFILGFRLIDNSCLLNNHDYLRDNDCIEGLEKEFLKALETIEEDYDLVFIKQLLNIYNYVEDKLLDVLKNKEEQNAKYVLYNSLSKAYWNPKCEMGRRMALKRYNKLLDIGLDSDDEEGDQKLDQGIGCDADCGKDAKYEDMYGNNYCSEKCELKEEE